MTRPVLYLLPLLLSACTATTRPRLTSSSLVDDIEYAHGQSAWRQQQALQTDITIDLGNHRALDGTLTLSTADHRARIDTRDGRHLVFDGTHAWSAPSDQPTEGARFALTTWPHFLAIPFRLHDPTAHTVALRQERLNGVPYKTLRLSYDPGTGDLADDWFRLYADDDTRRVSAVAYILNYNHKLTDPAPEPQGITYDDFINVSGVTLATTWYFRPWSEEKGFDPVVTGTAHLMNVKFTTPPPDFFNKPDNAKEDPSPAH